MFTFIIPWCTLKKILVLNIVSILPISIKLCISQIIEDKR